MQGQKKIPLRKCLGCNESKSKKELIRVVRSGEGEISLDTTGKKPGRGAYICPNKKCLQAARKAKRLERAFQAQIPDDVYAALEEALDNGEE